MILKTVNTGHGVSEGEYVGHKTNYSSKAAITSQDTQHEGATAACQTFCLIQGKDLISFSPYSATDVPVESPQPVKPFLIHPFNNMCPPPPLVHSNAALQCPKTSLSAGSSTHYMSRIMQNDVRSVLK